jgi:hypothetical protein
MVPFPDVVADPRAMSVIKHAGENWPVTRVVINGVPDSRRWSETERKIRFACSHAGVWVLKQTIASHEDVETAARCGQSVFAINPSSPVARDYIALAAEVWRWITQRRKNRRSPWKRVWEFLQTPGLKNLREGRE